MSIHASLTVHEPFMNSRIRKLCVFLYRGSNAEAGRKIAEEFSGRIHCFRDKCEGFLKTMYIYAILMLNDKYIYIILYMGMAVFNMLSPFLSKCTCIVPV